MRRPVRQPADVFGRVAEERLFRSDELGVSCAADWLDRSERQTFRGLRLEKLESGGIFQIADEKTDAGPRGFRSRRNLAQGLRTGCGKPVAAQCAAGRGLSAISAQIGLCKRADPFDIVQRASHAAQRPSNG